MEKGRCHCGQTEWEVKLDAKEHILWSEHALFKGYRPELWLTSYSHCDTCKILSGGTYTLNQIIPKEDLKVTKGNLKAYTYHGDSGKAVNCYYCPSTPHHLPNCSLGNSFPSSKDSLTTTDCTSHAYHHQEVMGDKVVVRTGLLESAAKMKPAAEIYGKARYGWEKEVAQTFDTMPPS
ncbi:Mss4-like protein [Glarea lozoyensis ATCC 20868]|uniref:Mss4-like protein n=1 Tax=Glarea lozoyensis (strain ATCC 20868 / MF5171) TaxID=1116229 RepID=S3D0J4_GLAL2|nr:Mss4-like protein [Glarea lozoyensis ATCC 20868]EPE30684.1 Mss4-like protein [Glarea lozoyensis ATCC 20868]